jgi:hypothetical protein
MVLLGIVKIMLGSDTKMINLCILSAASRSLVDGFAGFESLG